MKRKILACLLLLSGSFSFGQQPIYKDPNRPINERVEDLLSRMTLEEKIGQMNIPCAYKQRIGWGIQPNDQNPSLHRQLQWMNGLK
jgi:hypothetical protein